MRPRGRDKHLPPCVFHRHGAYWYVKRGKWKKIGTTLTASLAEYARIIAPPTGGCDDLLDRTLDRAKETVAANTHQQYAYVCRVLKPVLAEFTPELVESHHIAAILDHHRKTPNMANRMLTFLRLAFSNGLTWGMCKVNPCYGVKRHIERRRERDLTPAEFLTIRENAPPQLQAIMDICYLTGQRIGDVLAIRLSQIAKEGIYFRQQKTGKRLLVAMTPTLEQALERARSLYSNVRGLTLFHGRGGRPLSYYGVRSAFQRAAAKAKVEDVTLHDIRARSAGDAKNPKDLLGHTTEAMTARYLRSRETKTVNGPSIGQLAEYWTEEAKKSAS